MFCFQSLTRYLASPKKHEFATNNKISVILSRLPAFALRKPFYILVLFKCVAICICLIYLLCDFRNTGVICVMYFIIDTHFIDERAKTRVIRDWAKNLITTTPQRQVRKLKWQRKKISQCNNTLLCVARDTDLNKNRYCVKKLVGVKSEFKVTCRPFFC